MGWHDRRLRRAPHTNRLANCRAAHAARKPLFRQTPELSPDNTPISAPAETQKRPQWAYQMFAIRMISVEHPETAQLNYVARTRTTGTHQQSDEEERDVMTIPPIAVGPNTPTLATEASTMDRTAIEAVIEALPDLYFLLADDGRVVHYRAGEAGHLYTAPETFVGAALGEFLPEQAASLLSATVERCKASLALESCEYRLQLDEGPVWFEARLKVVADGKHIVCLIRDISAHRRAMARLDIYASAVSSTRDLLAVVGADYRYLMVNASYADFLDVHKDSVCGMRIDEVVSKERISDSMHRRLERCLMGEIIDFQEWCEKPGSGDRIYVNVLYTPLRQGDAITGVVISGRDITPLHEARKELEHLAHYDSLTGLPNRTMVNSLLDDGIKRARRGKHRLAVMFIDLDRFKAVNDTLGHAAGDALLVEASQRMSSLLRDTDAIARVGGDEFVIILNHLLETGSASTVATKLMQRLMEPFNLEGHHATISCSIGISVYPDDANDRSELFRFADTAMYRAKTQGRNDWRFYTPDMTASATRRVRMMEALRQALAGGALIQVYHPLIDLSNGACVAFEALARWHDPQLGNIAPSEFLNIAEQSGLVRELDLWSLRTACQRMRDWLDNDIAPDYISVNLSEASLSHAGFCAELKATLKMMSISPSRLQLEVSESVILRNDVATSTNLQHIAALGMRLALDNFGTGYATLSQLCALPIKTLKIDGTFIQSITPGSSNGVIIANTIIAMGEALRMSLVAGGIEDTHQANFVRARAGILGQSFFFGQPLNADQTDALMRESHGITERPPDRSTS